MCTLHLYSRMRLLQRIHGGGLSLTENILDEATVPPYAILSDVSPGNT